ncbi:hypothetical protein EQ870_15500 [Enterococcus casseliflavus]|nr:hypothetical protein EQ870_15500 [Enterococcus casseliflavus]
MNKEQRRKRMIERKRLVYLAEHPDFDTNSEIRAAWEYFKDETTSPYTRINGLIEVVHEGEVIFTGNRAEVRTKFAISHSNLSRKLRENRPDRKKRYYRIKD